MSDFDAEADADVIVIGGGPAGLTAAIYLSRFLLKTLVVDRGDSRAALIPVSHNHAGYPDGIGGPELVARMRAQAAEYGTRFIDGEARRIAVDADGFVVAVEQQYRARAVLIATGVRNRRPAMPDDLHDAALAGGQLRYCPVCDAYEVTDRRVGVIGSGEHGVKEALFLRAHTADLTLIAPDGAHDLDDDQRRDLAAAGIVAIDGPATEYRLEDDRLSLTASGKRLSFDSIYPALGSDVHSDLAKALGAETADDGAIVVDSHQRTSVTGLYAAGDVVLGLDQISHAMGDGGVAATTIRNDLAALAPLRR